MLKFIQIEKSWISINLDFVLQFKQMTFNFLSFLLYEQFTCFEISENKS